VVAKDSDFFKCRRFGGGSCALFFFIRFGFDCLLREDVSIGPKHVSGKKGKKRGPGKTCSAVAFSVPPAVISFFSAPLMAPRHQLSLGWVTARGSVMFPGKKIIIISEQ